MSSATRARIQGDELEYLHSLDATFAIIIDKLDFIQHQLNQQELNLSANQDVLLEAFTALDSAVNDLTTSEAAGAAEIESLAATIKAIPPGTTLTVDQLNGLATQATAAAAAMNAAVSAQTPVPVDPTVPVVDPAAPPVDSTTPGTLGV